MTEHRRWPVVVVLAILVSLIASATTVHASGFNIARFGGEHGTVNSTNPTALYYNPAGIGFSTGTQLFVDGQLAMRSLGWTHEASVGDVPEPAGFEGANYGTATAFNLFGGPMLGGSMRLGDFAFGAAAYAPFGGNVHFDRNSSFEGGAADGVARWHAFDAGTMSIYGTLGAAYRLGPVSLGVTGNLIFSSLEIERAQNVGGGAGINDIEREGRSTIDVSGIHGSFGLGAMVEAIPDTLWVSASYQAQPGLGEMLMDGQIVIDATADVEDETLPQDVTFHQGLPDVFRLGARFQPSSSLELRLAGDLTRWSMFRTQCIAVKDEPCTVMSNGDGTPDSGVVVNLRRYWKDTVGVRGGGSYWVMPELELFVGLGYETGAVPDSTLDPVLADANNMSAALGARLQFAETWFIAGSYTHLQFFSRDNTGKSELADPDVGVITRRPDGGGEYRQWVGVLDVNLMKTF
ncbi:MAG TPA: outer membrane protein transport protein [Polyangiales bacterium]|nr:outer membrane protein transport protein [Polyangiales bacterium]